MTIRSVFSVQILPEISINLRILGDIVINIHTGVLADKSLVRPGRKRATGTEDFDFHISYL